MNNSTMSIIKKIKRLYRTIETYLLEHKIQEEQNEIEYQLDVIAATIEQGTGKYTIEYLDDVTL